MLNLKHPGRMGGAGGLSNARSWLAAQGGLGTRQRDVTQAHMLAWPGTAAKHIATR